MITDQVQPQPFYKKLGISSDVSLVQCMQHGVTGTVRNCTGATGLFTAKISRLSAKRTLIDFSILQSVKWHPEMLQLIYHFGSLATHEFDRILIPEVIRTLDGIIHVPVPIILSHISQ